MGSSSAVGIQSTTIILEPRDEVPYLWLFALVPAIAVAGVLLLCAAARSEGRARWRWLPPFAVLTALAILTTFTWQDFPGSLSVVEDGLVVLSGVVIFATFVTITLLGLGELARTLFSRAWRHVYWRGFGIKHLLIFTAAAAFTCTVRRGLPANDLPFDYLIGLFAVLLLAWLVIHCAVVDFGRDQQPPGKTGHERGDESPWSELPILFPPPSEASDRPGTSQCLTRLRWWWARRNRSPTRRQPGKRGRRANRHATGRRQQA